MCIYTYQWSKLWSVIGHDWPDFNLTKQSFPEICRNDRSLNETIWTSKCDKLHVFGMVERMERTKFVHWNIWGFRSNFVDCESFLESNSLDILALCETNLDDSIDSGNFSVRGYLPLIRKDSSAHMHRRSLCERKIYFYTGLISRKFLFLKFCRFLFMFLAGFTSLSVLLHFPLSITFFSFVHGFWFYFI